MPFKDPEKRRAYKRAYDLAHPRRKPDAGYRDSVSFDEETRNPKPAEAPTETQAESPRFEIVRDIETRPPPEGFIEAADDEPEKSTPSPQTSQNSPPDPRYHGVTCPECGLGPMERSIGKRHMVSAHGYHVKGGEGLFGRNWARASVFPSQVTFNERASRPKPKAAPERKWEEVPEWEPYDPSEEGWEPYDPSPEDEGWEAVE